jgi:hypothetical protein
MRRCGEPGGHFDRGITKFAVSSTDAAECPVDALLHEVAVIGGGSLDEPQPVEERTIARRFVVASKARQECERGTFAELVGLATWGRAARGRRSVLYRHRGDTLPTCGVSGRNFTQP